MTITEQDDNTLDNAGPVGRDMADTIADKVTEAIEGFPASSPAQRAAIARMIANTLGGYADEVER